jgi:signal transduction histidine kinase
MRQPVASVLALAAAALAEPGLPRAVRERLKQIVQQAEWLAEIIQDGLHAAVPAEPGSCADLARIISEAATAEHVTSSVEINVVWPAEPLHVSVHPVALRRIMANLLSNAARAAGSSGIVTIGIRSQDGQALVVVDDSGPGFGGIREGLGLGLQEVARNVVLYGGSLEYGCASLGGVRASLWLPLRASRPRLAPAGSI